MTVPEAQMAALRDTISKCTERIAVLETQVEAFTEQVKTFVTQAEFGSVKLVTYGIMIAMGGSVMTSLMGKIFIK